VASLAESFIHEELTLQEKRTIRESFHPDLASSAYSYADGGNNVPGSIDPFLSAEDDELNIDAEPAGVSMFASLIERLLARFEFDAIDTKITIVHPGKVSFTISISEIRYGTEPTAASLNTGGCALTDQMLTGETRKVSISGLSITARNLHRPTPFPSFPATPSTLSPTVPSRVHSQLNSPPHSPRSISPSSSSSSLDEEAQLRMSQSLVSLPPRPPSPSSSVASSLYHSAISLTLDAEDHSGEEIRCDSRTPSPLGRRLDESNVPDDRPSTPPHQEDEAVPNECEVLDEMILSFGTEPVVFRLTTPPSLATNAGMPSAVKTNISASQPGPHSIPSRPEIEAKVEDKLRLSLDIGTIACALQAWQIQRLSDLIKAWTSHLPQKTHRVSEPDSNPKSSNRPPKSLLGNGLDGNLRVRNVVIILSPSSNPEGVGQTSALKWENRFFANPLLPPKLANGYVRALLETLSMPLTLGVSTLDGRSTGHRSSERARGLRGKLAGEVTTTISSTLSISEISILAVHAAPLATLTSEQEITTSPVLITDRHLSSQYPAEHFHPNLPNIKLGEGGPNTYPLLPTFDVIDWTDKKHWMNGLKLSKWRHKVKHKKHEPVWQDNQDAQTRAESASTNEIPRGTGKHDKSYASSHPAIVIHTQRVTTISSTRGRRVAVRTAENVEVNTVPIHIFVDLGMALDQNGVLSFLNAITGSNAHDDPSGQRVSADDESSHDSDHPTSEAEDTLSVSTGVFDAKARAKERLRLEKLVLQDMDPDTDFQRKGGSLKSGKTKRKVHCIVT
jgi:autophagy-related protein 2